MADLPFTVPDDKRLLMLVNSTTVLICIVGIIGKVMIGFQGWFDGTLTFTIVVLLIGLFPYAVLYAIWRKASTFLMFIVVLLGSFVVAGIDGWTLHILTTRSFSDGADWFIPIFNESVQLIVSLFVWVIFLFLRKKRGKSMEPDSID